MAVYQRLSQAARSRRELRRKFCAHVALMKWSEEDADWKSRYRYPKFHLRPSATLTSGATSDENASTINTRDVDNATNIFYRQCRSALDSQETM